MRPTKKQFETLEFIKQFIDEHGYSPSYREIMRGCQYTSVATVALHVHNLIARGHIVKRGNSARSLELVDSLPDPVQKSKDHHTVSDVVSAIEDRFVQLEKRIVPDILDEIYVLVGALKILGGSQQAKEYAAKIAEIKSR